MPFKTFQMFAGYVSEVQAHENLIAATVASVPHMEKKDRKRIYDSWARELGMDPKELKTGRRIASEDIRRFIGAPEKGTPPKIKLRPPKKGQS